MHNYCDFAENSGKGRSLILKCIWCLLAFDSYEAKYVRKAGEDAMIRKYLVKYIIFLLLFLLCIGAAWYCAKKEDAPAKDAVLVYAPQEESVAGLVV